MSTSALHRAMAVVGEEPGQQTRFAELVGCSQQLVSYWVKTGRVGGRFVLAVEEKTGVSRHDLRPDIFGAQPASADATEQAAA